VALFVNTCCMPFFVYVLYAQEYDKIYVGFTSNLDARFKSHNEISKKGWTVRYRPWKLVHQETFDSKGNAMKREKELKSAQGRQYIRNNIIQKM